MSGRLGNVTRRHSLSLALGVVFLVQTAAWVAAEAAGGGWARWAGEYLLSVLADTYGALILVLATKRLYEVGSAESN